MSSLPGACGQPWTMGENVLGLGEARSWSSDLAIASNQWYGLINHFAGLSAIFFHCKISHGIHKDQ